MEQTQTPFFHALFKPELRQMFDHKGRKTDKFKLHETGWDAEVHVPKEWVLQAQANHRERPCSLGSLRKDQIFLAHSSWGQWYPPEFHVWMYQSEIFLADNSIVTQTDFETVLSEYRARIQEAEDAAARREEEDVLISQAEAIEAERARERKVQWARGVVANAENPDLRNQTRQAISREIKIRVWERDRGRCVECGSDQLLEFDHIIPLAMGGSNTEKNLQLLCSQCNQSKGSSLG